MSATLFNRYIWLVDTIYSAGRISLEEINRRWARSAYNDKHEESIPERTFHRHKEAIKAMFDIDIRCDKKAGNLYYIAHAEDMEQGGVRKWLINTFAVNNLINESHTLKRRILFEEIPSGQRFLTPIIEAMRDERTVEICYRSFGAEQARTFELEPYCVKVFRQRWYFIARSPSDERIRIYGLDRIEELQMTEHRFRISEDFDGIRYFEQSFGIIVDETYDIETVRIRIDARQRKYLRSLPLHGSQIERETTDAWSIFEFRLRPTFDFQQELRMHGAAVEVLAPAWLREAFRHSAHEQADMYDK